MADLRGVLAAANLAKYHDGLRDIGVASPDDFVDVDDEDLLDIGMTKVEVKRLRRNAAGGAATDPAPATIASPLAVPEWSAGPVAEPPQQSQAPYQNQYMGAAETMATQLQPQRAPQPQMVTVMDKQISANVLLGAAVFFFVLSLVLGGIIVYDSLYNTNL
eukprot:COSAG05_NODE_1237_length_5434_cov_7.991565_5_plen_161_part_00